MNENDNKTMLEIMAENLDTVENVRHMIHFHALACLDLSEHNAASPTTAELLKKELDRMSHALQEVSDILDIATNKLYEIYYQFDKREDVVKGEGA